MATEELSDLLSEFARTMVTDFPIQAILDHLVERIVAVMPITGAGVTLISASTDPRYIAASDDAAMRFEKLQSSIAEGPCLAAFRSGEAVSVPDLRNDARFPRFGPKALESGLRAVFAFPLRHGDNAALGALDLYRDEVGPLDDAAMYEAQTLADVAAAYILNAEAREELQEVADGFRKCALHDPLTGLPNRVLFKQRLDHAVLRARRAGGKLAILFADLDRFKEVNDLFGHQVGDELLVALAARLTAVLRPGDTLARLAGDEFVILCEDLDGSAQVRRLADRIDDELNEPFLLSGHELHTSASVGIAFSGRGDDIPEQILRDADAAMYQAKRRGGGGHQILDLREQERNDKQISLRHDLHNALAYDQLEAHYQPIVAAADGRIVGVETLVRWAHPTQGVVSPTLLIPLAEQSRLIGEIDRWVLTQACQDRNGWQRRDFLRDEIGISVNVSASELLASDYATTVASVLAATGTEPHLLTVEITESVFIDDPERALLVLNDLKQLGVLVALDDFGTGYSSLCSLQQFPVDVVKIDQSLIAKLGSDPISTMIVSAIVELAHAMGMSVTAEGAETAAQYQEVIDLGCESCQGFYLARPMPADEMDALLQECSDTGSLLLPVHVDA